MKHEDQNTEYKRSWRDEYLKWICAFANADGGTLYVGIEDDGTVVGVADAKRMLEDVPNKISSTMGLVCPVSIARRKGKDILKIVVKPSRTPISYHGEFHVRSGATKQLLTGPALTQFILDKTGVKWDGLTVDGVKTEDLDHESFELFARNAIASGRMSRDDVEVDRRELLDKLGLVRDGKLTYAAILLFHRRPEKWVPSCYSQIGYFLNDADLKFQDEIRGSLMIQAERIMELLFLKYLIAPITYREMLRIDKYPYPKDAVRELVYNALMHQDFVNGGSVQVSVYPDKLYISNAGGLPPKWTIAKLMGKHRSEVRNDLVASVFYRAGFVERWGRGIEKVCAGLKEHGNPAPVYDVCENDVMVRLDAVTPQVAPQVTPQVAPPVTPPVTPPVAPPVAEWFDSPLNRLLYVIGNGEKSAQDIRAGLALVDRTHVRSAYVDPALHLGYIEYTIPDKPHSRLQKYRLTAKGKELLAQLLNESEEKKS